MRQQSRSVFLFALALASATIGFGQVAGRVTGSVTDQSGAAVPDADISLRMAGGAQAYTTKSTGDGNFTLPAV